MSSSIVAYFASLIIYLEVAPTAFADSALPFTIGPDEIEFDIVNVSLCRSTYL
jgi:hypothetical protein